MDKQNSHRQTDGRMDGGWIHTFIHTATVAQRVKNRPINVAVLGSRRRSFKSPTGFFCTQPFIIARPSSGYD